MLFSLQYLSSLVAGLNLSLADFSAIIEDKSTKGKSMTTTQAIIATLTPIVFFCRIAYDLLEEN